MEARNRLVDTLFESAADGTLVCDIEGRCEDVSFTACTLLGRTRSELLARPFAAHVLRPYVHHWWHFLEEVRVSGHAQTDVVLVRADGASLPVEIAGRCTSGAAPALVIFLRDARPRRHVESELARARAELDSLSSSEGAVTDAIAELPQTGVEIALQTIAFQAEVLTGAGIVAIVCGEEPSGRWIFGGPVRPELAAAARREAAGCVQTAMRERRAAQERRARMLAVPVLLRGRAEGAVVLTEKRGGASFDEDDERVARMIAARVAAALASARLCEGEAHQHAWLQSVFDQMPEGVTVFDATGALVQQNPMARANGELCAPDGRPLAAEEMPAARVLRTGRTMPATELAVRTRDGELLPVLVSAAPLSDGERGGAVMLCREIGALKELERMREEWASIVAHDLRQPVGIVRLNADLLVQQLAPRLEPKQVESLRRIQSCTERLHRMIDDLADASMIEANRLRVEVRAVDLADMVERAVASFRPSWSGRIEVDLAASVLVAADPDRIEQVLANLLTNAVKYGEPGSAIRVRVTVRDDDAVVSVGNRGAGIAAEDLPHVFSRFTRATRARRSATKGLGLGLYIARGLVDAHGGRIWAQSAPGDVTTFSFTLPRVAAVAREA